MRMQRTSCQRISATYVGRPVERAPGQRNSAEGILSETHEQRSRQGMSGKHATFARAMDHS